MCTTPAPDRLWIEIDLSAEPMSGAIHHGRDPVRRFSGWLELVALLETERQPGGAPIVPREHR
jgi:hypothetical protein